MDIRVIFSFKFWFPCLVVMMIFLIVSGYIWTFWVLWDSRSYLICFLSRWGGWGVAWGGAGLSFLLGLLTALWQREYDCEYWVPLPPNSTNMLRDRGEQRESFSQQASGVADRRTIFWRPILAQSWFHAPFMLKKREDWESRKWQITADTRHQGSDTLVRLPVLGGLTPLNTDPVTAAANSW